jgi:hypothetical protein
MMPPIASGWSDCRVGFATTGKPPCPGRASMVRRHRRRSYRPRQARKINSITARYAGTVAHVDAIASRDGDLPRDGRDGIVWLGSTVASAALVGRDVARRDSSLWAAQAARTSAFSCFGTLAKSRVRPSSAATSSNPAGEIRRSRWVSSRPSGVVPGLVAVNWKGPSETLQTTSKFRPGNFLAGKLRPIWVEASEQYSVQNDHHPSHRPTRSVNTATLPPGACCTRPGRRQRARSLARGP